MVDINKIKSIHFIGIKGVAMTALAIVAKERGIDVTGSDTEEEFPTDKTLHRFHIPHQKGFATGHLPEKVDLVIYTGAHQGSQNIEVREASKRQVPLLPHGKALGLFMQGKRGISVAGSHGKTTTSAMLAHVLTKLGKDPSFAIGCGEILSLKTSGHAGAGELFVAEGDEYVTDPTNDKTPRFMWQKPELLVITNIDFDHPDVYPDLVAIQEAFVLFTDNVTSGGAVIINADDTNTTRLTSRIRKRMITYGNSPLAQFRYTDMTYTEGKTRFTVSYQSKYLGEFSLKVPGAHNVANTTAVIATLMNLGLDPEKIAKSLTTFSGTKRRFELVVDINGKLFYDDYAHHPAEIAATLKAVREWYPKRRIIAVFQPHTYSRTKALLDGFAGSFSDADTVLLTEIYASAREQPIPGVSGQTVFQAAQKHHTDVFFAPKREDVLQYLRENTRANDLILTMGAGDIFTWISEIREVL